MGRKVCFADLEEKRGLGDEVTADRAKIWIASFCGGRGI